MGLLAEGEEFRAARAASFVGRRVAIAGLLAERDAAEKLAAITARKIADLEAELAASDGTLSTEPDRTP
jgi:hypothetical protein